MEKSRKISGAVIFACIFFVSTSASSYDLNLRLLGGLEKSDNALRDDENKLDELQKRYGLNIVFDEVRSDYEANINYSYQQYTFDKGSQKDRNILEGGASFKLGRSNRGFGLLLSNTRRRSLIDNSEIDILANNDERSISELRPTYALSLTPADILSFQYSKQFIDYEIEQEKSTLSDGASVYWIRSLSPISRLSLSLSASEIEFENIEGLGYQYESFNIDYSVALRKINYDINFGYKSSDGVGDKFSGPVCGLNLDYTTPVSTFGLSWLSIITDTSSGNNNTNEILDFESPGNSDATSPVIDQYRLSRYEMDYVVSLADGRGRVGFSIGKELQSYNTLEEEDNEIAFGNAYISISLGLRGSLTFRTRKTETEFKFDSDRNHSTNANRIEFQFAITNHLDAMFFGEELDYSEIDTNRSYKENLVGINIVYSLN